MSGLPVEVLRRLRWALDPALWLRESMGFTPDANQEKVLYSTAKNMLLNCHRQWGKSTTCAQRVSHRSIFLPKRFTILIGPTKRQSGELHAKTLEMLETVNEPLQMVNKDEIRLVNKSRILALPGDGDNIRGYSAVDEVIVDELAFIPKNSSVLAAVRPMLSTRNGCFAGLSTPNGKTNQYFDWWEDGGDAWERHKFTVDQCSRISKEYLENERKVLGHSLFRQEYYGEFMDTMDAVFMGEDTRAAIEEHVPTFFKLRLA